MPDRQIKAVNFLVVADPALIVNAIPLKYVGLPRVAEAECPHNWNSDRLLSVAGRIDFLIALALDPQDVATVVIDQDGMLR